MKSLTKTVFQLVAALIVLSTQTLAAFAQAWPNKPVKLVAVFPPGGSVDQVARIMSVPSQKVLGQPVIVDNKIKVGE
jgi:tripartite-type tricarboxylate transporter receptor subunit TctC